MKQSMWLQLRTTDVRDVFDMSASNNLIPPSSPIELSVLSENKESVTITIKMERSEGCI
jgi:hypothetical protein